jgi:integrase
VPKRGENIRKRKDGRWEGRVRNGRSVDGKPKYRSVYGRCYLEAKRKLCAARGMPESESHLRQGSERCFRESICQWLESRRMKLRPQTIDKYSRLIRNHLDSSIGCLKASQVDANAVNAFLAGKLVSGRLDGRGGLSVSYVGIMKHVVSSAMRLGVSNGICRTLSGNICALPKRKPVQRVITLDEQYLLESFLLANMDASKLGVLISLNAGLRIGEICGLRWSDIDFDQCSLTVQRTVFRSVAPSGASSKTILVVGEPKTMASSRVVPLPSFLMPILSCRKSDDVSCAVASDNGKACFDPRTMQYRFKRYLKDCGIPDRNFHALRHAYATRCIEAGVDVKSLSEMLGHSSVSITLNTYVHTSLEQKRRQVGLLEAFRGQISGQAEVSKRCAQ